MIRCASHRTATACGCGRVGCQMRVTWPQHGMARVARGCGNGGTLARCLRSWHWARGTIPPAPRHVIIGVPVGWPQTCVPVYRYAVVCVPPRTYHATAFTAISSEIVRTHKSTLSTGGHCVASRHVSALSTVAGVVPNSLRVPRDLVCSSRQLYRQPAPRRPLPRRGY